MRTFDVRTPASHALDILSVLPVRVLAAGEPVQVACIGTREPTEAALELCESIGRYIAVSGGVVRTGNAAGCDQAFARGANSVDPRLVVLVLPWATYERTAVVPGNQVVVCGDDVAYRELVTRLHPAPHHLTRGAWALHTRNVGIVAPCALTIAYPHRASRPGGTGLGMAVAGHFQIPLLDLTSGRDRDAVAALVHMTPQDAP